ncbi:MAG: aminoacyl-tRNA hydrolase [Elusimicrobiaceae bacterium]|nr:aminoacyl-tRNA hydrolase [Elusimicrobiaceae bacterium]
MQYLLVGLGNPGPEYERTRHNVGFRMVDAAASKWGVQWQPWQKLGVYGKVSVAGCDVFLLKPHTYMNLSGQAVSSLARFYKITPDRVIVCFDDVSLEVGKLRLRGSGSAGGQKGMKNIIEQMGTDKIARLRCGIGPKPEKFDLVNFVLGKFSRQEEELLEPALTRAVCALESYFKDGLQKAMNEFN